MHPINFEQLSLLFTISIHHLHCIRHCRHRLSIIAIVSVSIIVIVSVIVSGIVFVIVSVIVVAIIVFVVVVIVSVSPRAYFGMIGIFTA